MLSPVNCNTTGHNTSFKGIVKVGQVYVDGQETSDFRTVDLSVKQLKAILMRQKDSPETYNAMNTFRKFYAEFDKDYFPPSQKMTGDTRDIMTKVRPKDSSDTFIATGNDAKDVAYSGIDIGKKRSLARNLDNPNNQYAGENALYEYRATKDFIAGRYNHDKENQKHPQVIIYTEKDKKGKIRIQGAKLLNDLQETKKFYFNPISKGFKTQNLSDMFVRPTYISSNEQRKPIQLEFDF